MRLISFAMTTGAFLSGQKTVTRRLGWKNIKPGERLMGVKKCMGFRPGEKVEYLGEIEVLSVRRESLGAITEADVLREGFHNMTREEFLARFCGAMKCTPSTEVTRIEFKRVPGGAS